MRRNHDINKFIMYSYLHEENEIFSKFRYVVQSDVSPSSVSILWIKIELHTSETRYVRGRFLP